MLTSIFLNFHEIGNGRHFVTLILQRAAKALVGYEDLSRRRPTHRYWVNFAAIVCLRILLHADQWL